MRIIKNIPTKCLPWNKDRLIGQKLPLTLKQIWSIRMSLQSAGKVRDLALFNLAIDSKLRACDLLQIKVSDVCSEGLVNSRATVVQQKTRRPVKFEITDRTKRSIENRRPRWASQTTFSRAGRRLRLTCRCDSTRELWRPGYLESV